VMNAVPRLAATPPRIDWLGPELGAHNEEIYCGRLGLSTDDLRALKARGIV
jgi:crotonobetainyl-CoA:carnitine CoA-transferase CaiB-like acyl-CoA transferase